MSINDFIRTKLAGYLSDELYLRLCYFAIFRKPLNLHSPITFNEKLQWLKLHDRKPLYTTLADKNTVKDYVGGIIGSEHIIPTLGVWDRFDDICLDSLPEQFVLKCNHYGGGKGVVIAKNKSELDVTAAKDKLEKCLRRPAYAYGREWPYKAIVPCILAEEYIEDSETKSLRDYKFYCFNGVPRVLLVASDRQNSGARFDFFDMEYRHLDIKKGHGNSDILPEKPSQFNKMIEIASVLAKDIPFVRVDLYETDKKVYFGELTLYPASGFVPFEPKEWDKILGDWLVLPTQ